jgi:hypothetical protein
MKSLNTITKKLNTRLFLFLAFAMLFSISPVLAQEESEVKPEVKKEKPARPAFESAWWFDGQTGIVYNKKTLEFVIQHRFSLIGSDAKELLGLYGPTTNTRLGLSYVPIENLSVGLGYTKTKFVLDLNAKYAIIKQTKSNSMPISLTYYGNMGIEMQDKINYLNNTDRLNYFNELIVMRRFGKNFSMQIAGSYTHYNSVKWEQQSDGVYKTMSNDSWGFSAGARYKLSSTLIIMAGYDQPLTQHDINQPLPSINIGLEIATSNHAFQIILTNYNKIQPQENYMFNQNDFTNGMWLIGFNITRLRSL